MYRFAKVCKVLDLVPPHSGDTLEVRVKYQQLCHEISVDDLFEVLREDIWKQLWGRLNLLFFLVKVEGGGLLLGLLVRFHGHELF